jgi:hypothetical protein
MTQDKLSKERQVADALEAYALIDEAEGGNPLVIATERRAAELLRNSASQSVGWREGIESAPWASTVLASYFDNEAGDWVVQLFVAERPTAPFTHWMLVTRPDEADYTHRITSCIETGTEGEPVAWQVGSEGAIYKSRQQAVDHVEGWAAQGVICAPVRPLYAHPSPQVDEEIAITDEMVEQLFQSIVPYIDGTAWREVRAALTTALSKRRV